MSTSCFCGLLIGHMNCNKCLSWLEVHLCLAVFLHFTWYSNVNLSYSSKLFSNPFLLEYCQKITSAGTYTIAREKSCLQLPVLSEAFVSFGFNILTVRRVEPYYVSWLISSGFWCIIISVFLWVPLLFFRFIILVAFVFSFSVLFILFLF